MTKLPQTGVLVDNRHLSLTALGARHPRSRGCQIWCPRGQSARFADGHLLAGSSAGREGALWGLFHEGTDPILEAPFPWPKHLAASHLLTASPWGLGVNIRVWGNNLPPAAGYARARRRKLSGVWCSFLHQTRTVYMD